MLKTGLIWKAVVHNTLRASIPRTLRGMLHQQELVYERPVIAEVSSVNARGGQGLFSTKGEGEAQLGKGLRCALRGLWARSSVDGPATHRSLGQRVPSLPQTGAAASCRTATLGLLISLQRVAFLCSHCWFFAIIERDICELTIPRTILDFIVDGNSRCICLIAFRFCSLFRR